ncbi:hypothetical protein [Marinobacter salarius]|uniref:Uncharacterized protein n=1 Tax=Marinobacter salarius TaxID=1420917 RepID=A0A1W6KFW9_9GAMM|nr:hypothetical protein [Marinobacter salarius]ARM86318.1 hypothetical protein MARSALSMR5_04301 [Marinobacter salarius]
MADDNTNDPNEKKAESETKDLFSSLMDKSTQQDDDPAALPDDLAFGSASGEEVDSNTQSPASDQAPSGKPYSEKPQLKAVDSGQPQKKTAGVVNIADAVTRKAQDASANAGDSVSAVEAAPYRNPDISDTTRAIAAALREQSQGMPQLRGWDAGLVQYDTRTGTLVPTDEAALKVLEDKGGDLNLSSLNPATNQWEPLRLGADSEGNLAIVRNPEESPQANKPMERLDPDSFRLSPTTTPMQKIKLSSDATDRLKDTLDGVEDGSGSRNSWQDDEDEKTSQVSTEPPATAGQLVAHYAAQAIRDGAQGIKNGLKAILEAIKNICSKLKEFAGGVYDSTKAYVSSRLANRGSSNVGGIANRAAAAMSTTALAKRAKAAVDGSGASGVADRMKAHQRHALSQLRENSTHTMNRFETSYKEHATKMHNGLGTNEAGAAMLRSQDDFTQRYSQRAEEHQAQVREGAKGLKDAHRDLAGGVIDLANDKRLDTLPPATRQTLLEEFGSSFKHRPKQNALEAAAMKHAADPESPSNSLNEELDNSQMVAREVLEQRMTEAKRQVHLEQMSQDLKTLRETQQDDQRLAGGMEPRPA